MKKIFLFLGIFVILSVFASADINDSIVAYWSFDDSCTTIDDDSGSGNTLSGGSSPAQVSAKIGNGCDWEAGSSNNKVITDSTMSNIEGDQSSCFCTWYKAESFSSSNDWFIYSYNGAGAKTGYIVGFSGTTDEMHSAYIAYDFTATQEFSAAGNFEHGCWGYNTTHTCWWYNGTLTECQAASGLNIQNGNLRYSKHGTSGIGYLDGVSDESVLWSRFCIDDGEDLPTLHYNDGDGCSLYNCSAPVANVSSPFLTINSNLTNTININYPNISISYNGTVTNYDRNFSCFLRNVTDVLITDENINLSTGDNFEFILNVPDETEAEWDLNIGCIGDTTYNVSSIETIIGTYISGDINSILTIDDDDQYIVQETNDPSDAYDVRVNGTNFVDYDAITLNYRYDGSPSHFIHFFVYNFTLDDWQLFDILPETDILYLKEVYIIDNSSDFIQNGESKARFTHPAGGNQNHFFYLDYLVADFSNITDETESFNYKFDTYPTRLEINSTVNNTIYFDNTVFENSVIYTDLNLFEIFSYVTDLDNTTTYDFFEQTNLTVTSFIYNISNSTSILGIGSFRGHAGAWDSHTDEELKTKVKIKEGGIEFGTLWFWCDDAKSYTVQEKKDKVSFEIEFDKKEYLQTCYYNTTGTFYHITHSRYPNHYVERLGRHWVDDYGGQITMIDRQTLKLEIDNIFRFDKYVTDSAGDLNYNEIFYFFNITAAPSLTEEYLRDINQTNRLIYEEIIDINEGLRLLAYILGFMGILYIGMRFLNRFLILLGYALISLVGLYLTVLYGLSGASLDIIRTGIGLSMLVVGSVLGIRLWLSKDFKKG